MRRLLHLLLALAAFGVLLSSLAVAVGEEAQTIEEVHEPYLIQVGFVKRTPKGRVAMPHAYKHFGLKPPADSQGSLF